MAGAKQRAGAAVTATGPKVVKATRLTPSHTAILPHPATAFAVLWLRGRYRLSIAHARVIADAARLGGDA